MNSGIENTSDDNYPTPHNLRAPVKAFRLTVFPCWIELLPRISMVITSSSVEDKTVPSCRMVQSEPWITSALLRKNKSQYTHTNTRTHVHTISQIQTECKLSSLLYSIATSVCESTVVAVCVLILACVCVCYNACVWQFGFPSTLFQPKLEQSPGCSGCEEAYAPCLSVWLFFFEYFCFHSKSECMPVVSHRWVQKYFQNSSFISGATKCNK